MKKALKTLQKKLVDLSSKNKSLLLLKLFKNQFIDIKEFNFLNDKPAEKITEELIAKKSDVVLSPVVDSRDKDANQVSFQLKRIHRLKDFFYAEQGIKDLYVGYPFVQGKLLDGTLVRCPLLLFPVDLSKKDGFWVLEQDSKDSVVFNKTLLLAYAYFNQTSVENTLLELDFSNLSNEKNEFLISLYQKMESSNFKVHMESSVLENSLKSFTDYTKDYLDSICQTGKLKIVSEAVLGFFPQSASYMISDFDLLLNQKEQEDFSSLFESKNITPSFISASSIQEEELILPFSIDDHQEKVIRTIKTGRSIAVQGPPGSGKSQLICNLISDAIAHRKSVLVVCQKKAALDVVYNRLSNIDLENFIGLVHDFRADRNSLYKKLKSQIEKVEEYERQNATSDIIYLEREFLKESRAIEKIVQELEDFRRALFDTKECGLSAKELYLSAPGVDDPKIDIKSSYQNFRPLEISDFFKKLKAYFSYSAKIDNENYPWYERRSFSRKTIDDLEKLKKTVQTIVPFFKETSEKIESLISMEITLNECEWVYDRKGDIKLFLSIIKDAKVLEYFKKTLGVRCIDRLSLSNIKKNILDVLSEGFIEESIPKKDLSLAQEKLNSCLNSIKVWYKKIFWKLFSKDKTLVNNWLKENKLKLDVDGVVELMSRIDRRMNVEHFTSKVKAERYLLDFPPKYNPQEINDWFSLYDSVLQAKKLFEKLRNGVRYLKAEKLDYESIERVLNKLVLETSKAVEEKKNWLEHLTEKQIDDILEGKLDSTSLLYALDEDFEDMCEFDQLKDSFLSYELDVINKLKHSKHLTYDKAAELFESSLQFYWLEHIESKFPVLRIVSSSKLKQLESELSSSIHKKKDLSKKIALIKAKEKAYEDLEYNRLKNLVTYRDLEHQVSKKRNIWPVRKLISSFWDEIKNIIPCWLVSPETVSAIFPMEENLFDLVVFDEASQCHVEKGIPSIYRSSQTVIVGDDKQLTPYDLYNTRWEETEEEETEITEILSLLDFGNKYLPRIPLKSHYRSQRLELIDFSNKHFYENNLQAIPDYESYSYTEPAIEYLKVDGEWKNNQNEKEANEVVMLLTKLLAEGRSNIGIITFNYPQQELITNLVEEKGLSNVENLFIKNIENVQGDEREIIIFSLGYAVNQTGKVNTNFGSLNHRGGENRLNVAITRAKSKIYVITSVLPHHLNTEQSKNEGPKLLKKYLQYAYDVSGGNYKPQLVRKTQHNIGWYLKEKLAKSLTKDQNIYFDTPLTDIMVKGHKHHLVLTDDDYYEMSFSTKDHYYYKPNIFKKKNWSFSHVYSRNFWRKKEETIQKIKNLGFK